MLLLAFVAAGGAFGATARYGLSGWLHTWAGTALPWGTLSVNALGSLLLGFAVRYLEFSAVSPELRAGLTVGFLGAFTTFSTYSYETVTLAQAGEWGRAAAYAAGSVVLGILFVFTGMALAHAIHSPRGG